ncbi:MAG: hypothetical protein ACRD8Z_22710 [Nitrososphaeraceae archaeon]
MSRYIFSIFCANTQTVLISSLIATIIIFQFGLQEMTVPALAQATTDDFTTYENPIYGINMLYPLDWTQSVNPLQSYTDVVAFYSPFQNFTDNLPSEVTLSVRTYSGNVSLNNYTEFALASLEQQGVRFNEYNVFQLAGNTAHSILFSPPESVNVPISSSGMMVWTALDNKIYQIIFNAEKSKFDDHLPLVRQMIDSLQIQPQ